MRRQRDNRVWRAEFRDWFHVGFNFDEVRKGNFVVEVGRDARTSTMWAVSIIDGSGGFLCRRTTAAKAKAAARGYFATPLCDWVAGEKVDGQWRPLDDQGAA